MLDGLGRIRPRDSKSCAIGTSRLGCPSFDTRHRRGDACACDRRERDVLLVNSHRAIRPNWSMAKDWKKSVVVRVVVVDNRNEDHYHCDVGRNKRW